MKEKLDKYSVSWSLDENHIYIDNDTLDERVLDISFFTDFGLSKESKIVLLKKAIKGLQKC